MRVVHVNNVAGVGSAAVQQARLDGLDWELWPLPAVRGASLPSKLSRRIADLARFRPTGRGADLLHIHYGLFGYYAWSVRRPYVLHLHGTDVRSTIEHRALGPWISRSVSGAERVVYSTPDLADAVAVMRSDAVWVPAPLSPDVCREHPGQPAAGPHDSIASARRVVFSSRWEPVKGLDTLVDIARGLRLARPDLELIGIDWGTGADRARQAGVRLVPFLPPSEFRGMLAGADVVVGQQSDHPLVVVADLEAMALRRPLVARYLAGKFYGDEAPIWNTADLDPIEAVLAVLGDRESAAVRADAGREWALRHHSPERFVRTVSAIYEEIISSRPRGAGSTGPTPASH